MTKIAIFNHKGGVGKTTLTVNTAAALCAHGKSVLLIDSDPQCNLTSYLFDDESVDDLLDKSDSSKGKTIWSAISPFLNSEGMFKDVQPFSTSISNLDIVPGDIQLSQFELDLATCWADCKTNSRRGFTGTGLMSVLADNYKTKYGYDVIFYDTGPNIGPLNRSILLGCDYFIVPGACDLFSVRALKTLGVTVARWIREWKQISMFCPSGTVPITGRPKYLGYIPQGFRVYGEAMTSMASLYHSRFTKQLRVDVLDQIRKIDSDLVPRGVSGSKLGEVRDYSSLVQKAQMQGVPLWNVFGAPNYQAESAKNTFDQIAESIIEKSGI